MSKVMKRSLLALCTFLFSLLVSLSVAMFPSKADDNRLFKLDTGAEIRMNDPQGIRFTVVLNSTVYNEIFDEDGAKEGKTLGMIIVPKKYVEDCDASEYAGNYFEYFTEVKGQMIHFNYSKDQVDDIGDGTYEIRGSIVNVLFENLNLDFVAMGYIKTETTEGASFEYTAIDFDQNARSIADVARIGLTEHYDELSTAEISTYRDVLTKAFYQSQYVYYNAEENLYYKDGNPYETLEEIMTPFTCYFAEHYLVINGEPVLQDTDEKWLLVGDTYTATPKVYDGYGLTADSVTSTTAVIEGGVLKLYYEPTATLEDVYNAAEGRIRESMWGEFAKRDGMVSLVEFDNKQAIKFDILPDAADVNWRREILFNMEEVFGSDLANVKGISFSVYLGSAYQTNGEDNYIELCNWKDFLTHETAWMNEIRPHEYYGVKHLTAGAWNTLSLVALNETAKKYVCFNIGTYVNATDAPTASWGPTYQAEKETGLVSDYCIYFADFKVVYGAENSYAEMSEITSANSVVSWTAVEGATGYQVKGGNVKSEWTNIGNVTEYDATALGEGYHRVAVRAVLASGYTSAKALTVKNPTTTEKIFAYATGAAETYLYSNTYPSEDGLISLVAFDGKECIELDVTRWATEQKRVAVVIDLEAMFGEDLSKVSSITFSYYLGSGHPSASCGTDFETWSGDKEYEYYKDNLFLMNGTESGAWNQLNCTWYTVTMKPATANAKYIFFMANNTLDTTKDCSVYLANFSVTYAE